MKNEFQYSTKGTFRGFRTQALYTLNRIIKENNDFCFIPEQNEDVDIYFNSQIKELVQVKNYSVNLNFKHLNPESKKEGSLIKRILKRFREGSVVETKIVSFGELGKELKTFKKNQRYKKSIIRKLEKENYNDKEIELFFKYVLFEEVDECQLEKEIFDYIKKSHVGFSPRITYEYLLYWIYKVSENPDKINKNDLNSKLNNIGYFLSKINSSLKEFGLSVRQLDLPKNPLSKETLEKEFYIGTNAKYEHIIHGLDVLRENKLEEIESKFKKNNVLIIHGASGQGKTALAYRFLHENYPNALTYEIDPKKRDPWKIINTLNAISETTNENIAIYIDVDPNDTIWSEIVKEISRHAQFKILITIREEDWNRSSLSEVDISYSEIKLSLDKNEAKKIYNSLLIQDKSKFLDFEDCWDVEFGGNGPLLEFTYLVTHGITLKSRLKNQVKRIKDEAIENNEIERLDFLKIASILGSYNCKTDLNAIIGKFNIKYPQFFIEDLKSEYLICEKENKNFIGGLHPIRSKIITEILTNEVIDPIYKNIEVCLNVIDEVDVETFLISCFREFNYNNEIIEQINNFCPKTWTGYGSVINSLIWIGVKSYFNLNKKVIGEIYLKLGKEWIFLIMPDLSNSFSEKFKNLYKNSLFSQNKVKIAEKLKNEFTTQDTVFKYLHEWIKMSTIPIGIFSTEKEWDNLGLSLFWISYLKIEKIIEIEKYNYENSFNDLSLNTNCNFLLGLEYYSPKNENLERYRSKTLEKFQKELLVPFVENKEDEIKLHCIIDIFEINNTFEKDLNDIVSYRLELIRKLYPYKKIYSSQGYGHTISFIDNYFDDTKKNIPIENLPLEFLTKVNTVFLDLVDEEFSSKSISEYIDNVINNRKSNLNLIKKLINNLKLFFTDKKNPDIFTLNNYNKHLAKRNVNEQLEIPVRYNIMTKFNVYKNVYKNYIFSLDNFFNQSIDVFQIQRIAKSNPKNKHIMKRLGKNYNSEYNRLSIINLHESYKNLIIFQKEFKKLFKNHIVLKDINKLEKEENKFFSLLISLWRIFSIERKFNNENIIEESRNEFKKSKKFNNEVIKLLGKKFSITLKNDEKNRLNYLIFNIKNTNTIDQEILNLVKEIVNLLKNIRDTDTEKLFLDIDFEYFKIIPTIKNKLLYSISLDLPLYKIFNLENNSIDFDIFYPQILSLPKNISIKKWEDTILKIKELNKIYNIYNVQNFLYHLKQLAPLTKIDGNEESIKILKDYVKEVSSLMSNSFQNMMDGSTFAINELNNEIEKLEKIQKKAKIYRTKQRDFNEKYTEVINILSLFQEIIDVIDSWKK